MSKASELNKRITSINESRKREITEAKLSELKVGTRVQDTDMNSPSRNLTGTVVANPSEFEEGLVDVEWDEEVMDYEGTLGMSDPKTLKVIKTPKVEEASSIDTPIGGRPFGSNYKEWIGKIASVYPDLVQDTREITPWNGKKVKNAPYFTTVTSPTFSSDSNKLVGSFDHVTNEGDFRTPELKKKFE